jgi:hypothetical protein
MNVIRALGRAAVKVCCILAVVIGTVAVALFRFLRWGVRPCGGAEYVPQQRQPQQRQTPSRWYSATDGNGVTVHGSQLDATAAANSHLGRYRR